MGKLTKEQAIAKFKQIPAEKVPRYNYRHRVSTELITVEEFNKFGLQVVKTVKHDPAKHGTHTCKNTTVHYHYIIKMTDNQVIQQLRGYQWEDPLLKSKYELTGLKNFGVFTDEEHYYNTLKYLDCYDEIELLRVSRSEDVETVLDKIRTEAKKQSKEKRSKMQDTAREIGVELDEVGKDLKKEIEFINVVKKYFPKYTETTEDEYLRRINVCALLKQREIIDRCWNYIRKVKQNEITRNMVQPLTVEELKELIALPSFDHTDKYMRKILNTIYNKRIRDNKCVLMWLCGSASAGKSVMMEILGYIFGPAHGLDKSQIWKDILAMDAPAKKNAR
jgi:hypothetical protein